MQVLNLTCNDVNVQRAEDFINTLISAYNEDWVRDKNQIATATSQFINDRLAVIEQELGHVDSDISSYKSEHLIPDLALVSQIYLDQSHEAANQVLELNNQLYMARYIRTFLADERNKGQLLPANSGLGNSTVEKQIADYNTLMLERNSLASNSSESNPLVVDRDNSLEASRNAIISSIDNQINALNAQVRAFRGSESKSRNQIASNPQQAKYLLSVERQQKVKEALYLFLLQKREENELSQAFTAYNTRIITPPMGPETHIARAPQHTPDCLCGRPGHTRRDTLHDGKPQHQGARAKRYREYHRTIPRRAPHVGQSKEERYTRPSALHDWNQA